MKRLLTLGLYSFFMFFSITLFAQPCNLTDASGCDCPDGSNDCDLLPNITVARSLMLDASNNPESPGELGVSVSTPNIGHGPLRVLATDYYMCGTDTIYSPGGYSGTCPDGTDARQLIKQQIYHKNPDGSMTVSDRWAGSMTYHASHGHMHVDDWGVYTLRTEVPGMDPLDWPIVGEGAKLGFCLMDFGSCSYYNGHCVDSTGAVLTTDAPNYGLGGGSYSCGTTNQGISAGWTDIYHYYLDGMQITIPSSVCNGDYMLVVHVDPYNYFLEENDEDNVEAVPITLTMQGGGEASVLNSGPTTFCEGSSVDLSLNLPGSSYLWSTGESTPSITATASGTYYCTVNSVCGTLTSDSIQVTTVSAASPVVQSDTSCGAGAVTLTATAPGVLDWYDTPLGGTSLATGTSYTTPVLASNTTYYVENVESSGGAQHDAGEVTHEGTSLYAGSTTNGYLIFDALADFTLETVTVITDQPGTRRIELRNSGGTVLASKDVFVDLGTTVITLDFFVSAGTDLELGTNESVNLSNMGGSSPEFQRTNGSSYTSYPYLTPGLLSINDSPFGTSYYYYFYDWKIAEPAFNCSSIRVPVEAVIDLSPGCGESCNPPTGLGTTGLTASAVDLQWDFDANVDGWQITGHKAGTPGWAKVQSTTNSRHVGSLTASTTYEWAVRARCLDGSVSGFSDTLSFTTLSARLTLNEAIEFELQPNPTRGSFTIDMEGNTSSSVELDIADAMGRSVMHKTFTDQSDRWEIVLQNAAPGLYFVRIQFDEATVVKPLVVID